MADLEKLPKSISEKLKSKLRGYIYVSLKQQPYFGKNIKKLMDYAPQTWRYRIGDFRIFYTIDASKKIISMLTISNRKDAY